MFFKLINACFVFALLMLSSCGQVKVIYEKLEAQADVDSSDKDTAQLEAESIKALLDHYSDVKDKVESLLSTREDIEKDKTALDSLYQTVLELDLMDPAVDVAVGDSQVYYDYQQASSALQKKILAANVSATAAEVDDIFALAETEQKKFDGSIKIRKEVEKIESRATSAQEQKNKVNQINQDIDKQQKVLKRKITDAAVNFMALTGAKSIRRGIAHGL